MKVDTIHEHTTGTEPKTINIDGEAFVTQAAFAKFIGRSIRTVARWHNQRLGPRRASPGGTHLILYRLTAIREWLAQGEAGGQRAEPVRGRSRGQGAGR